MCPSMALMWCWSVSKGSTCLNSIRLFDCAWGLVFLVAFGLGGVLFFWFCGCCLGDGIETLTKATGGLLMWSVDSLNLSFPLLLLFVLFMFSSLCVSLFGIVVFSVLSFVVAEAIVEWWFVVSFPEGDLECMFW